MTIRVVTDSTCDLPAHLAEDLGITVVPCNVMFGDDTYRDGVDLKPDEFFQKLGASQRLPTTSQPSVADFEAVYRQLLDEGHEIVSVHVSQKLSGTYNSAIQAKAEVGESAPITVIDSQMASIGLGLLALQAGRAAQTALDHRETAEKVRAALPQVNCVLALDTLEYLQKGGRIGKAQAFAGSLLKVKPILTLQEGEVHPLERPRSLDRAVRRLAEMAREQAPLRQLAVIHSTESERSMELKRSLSDLLPEDQIIETRFGPALGVYVGPRAFGVAFTREG